MGLKLYEETSVQAIANAIRAKNGSSDTYNISEMSTAIANIPSGGGGEGNTKVITDDIVLVSQNGSSVNWYEDGSVDFTWLGGSSIGFNYIGIVPIKSAKRVLVHIDELGESYQHSYSTEQRNWNFTVGLTNEALPQGYIDLATIESQGKLVTDVEVDVIDNYGKTDLNYVIDLSSYQNQDLYLFILAPGMTIEGLKVTLVYDNDYYLGEYEYHWSNDSKICVRKEVGAIKWFFIGLTKQDADIDVPAELVQYLPDFEAPGQYMHCIAFSEPDGTWDGSHYIGFVYPGTANVKIRSWYGNNLGGGTFWGVLDITHYPFIDQRNPYVDPTDVSAQAMKVGSKTITANGVYSAEDDGYTGYSDVAVNITDIRIINMNNNEANTQMSMKYVSCLDSASVIWNNTSNIGCSIHFTDAIDVTNVDKIVFKLKTNDCYGHPGINVEQQTTERFQILIGLVTSWTGIDYLVDSVDSLAAYKRFAYTNTVYTSNECYLDVSDITGNVYIGMDAHGWNASLEEIRLL